MDHSIDDIRLLLKRYMDNEASVEENHVILEAIAASSDMGLWENLVAGLYGDQMDITIERNLDPVLIKVLALIRSGKTGSDEIKGHIPRAPIHRVHFLRRGWFRYAAAVILCAGIGAYLWNSKSNENSLVQHTQPVPSKNDIAPGSNRAVLTLSDGRHVELSAETKNIAETGTTIQNDNGRLTYGKGETVVMNTMSTPRGGQYQLILPDGSNVWLNAASSITYPTAFTGKTRQISITGEAYFEVAKNKSKPFIVKTITEEITVLGTSFNVNTYPDESSVKTSLVEGSVKINEAILKPGEAYKNGKVMKTDVQQDLAWKNGILNFNGVSLQEAMRQISRWYDVDVVYEKGIPNVKFGGRIGRDLNLSQVTRALEMVGLHFRIEGRKLIVNP